MHNLLKKDTECSLAQGISVKVAQSVAWITRPVFVAVPTFLLIALHTAPDLAHAYLWWSVIVVGLSLFPFVFVWWGVRKGQYTDQQVSRREQRIVPLFFTLACTAAVFVSIIALGASRVLIATLMAVFIGGSITLFITRFWKISLHLAGIAGSVTVLSLVYGPIFLLFSPLVVLVGWARWRTHAHSLLQILAGTGLAVGVTVAIFGLFGLL